MNELSRGLTRVGLDPGSSDVANLKQLWKLYQGKEDELKRVKKSLAETEENKRKEMKGVESYIENIRKVTEERDAITEELEAENEALKDELKQLREEMNGRKHEMEEILRQGGLDELAEGSLSEAVAYLMIERSRLMDDIKQAEKLSQAKTAGEAQEHLAKEVKALKEELQEEKIKHKIQEENLKQEYKRQISDLEEELEKSVKDCKEKEKRNKDLNGEVKKLKLSLVMEKRRKKKDSERTGDGDSVKGSLHSDSSESKIPVPKVGKDLTALREGLLKSNEGTTNIDRKVKELTAALEAEKKRKSSYEATIIKLKTLLDKNKKEITGLQQENKELEKENQSLEDRLNQVRSDAKLLNTRERALSIQNESLKEESESVSQLYKELEELRKQSQASSTKLEVTMVSLEVERKKCSSLEDRLKETEVKWEGVISRYKENEKDLKSELSQLTRELETSKDDVASSHREIMKLKAQQDRVLDNSKSEAERLRIQLMKEQEQARDLKRQLEKNKTLETSMEEVKKDRDVLAKELQTLIAKEQKSHAAVTSMEVLETENKTLKEQLNESFKKQSDLIQDLSQVQSKNRELSANLSNAKDNLQSTEETMKFLREELNRKSKELIDTFDFSREGQSKIESEVVNLHRNMEENRTSFNRENNDLKLRLDVEERKNEELQRTLKEKTEEIANLRREVSRLSLSTTRLEKRMQEEEKQRRSVESRNKVLEEELEKLWSQLKEVLDKHAANELSKTELEGELFRLTNLMKESDNHRAERQAENSAAINALSRAQLRAQAAERKIPELQEELDNTLLKLETAQTHAENLAASRNEINVLKEDSIKLKLQLQEEKVNSSMLAKQLEDIQGHLKSTEERERHLEQMNSDLKHQLLNTQSELTDIKDKHRNVEDLHIVSEQGKQTLQERASGLQSELTRLQMELSQTANQLDNQSRKYMNLKLQMKEKMENAREIFNRHKAVLVENIQQVQNELNSVKGELEKQQNDKEELKKKNQTLLTENRQLMERLAENDESINDQGRNISSLEYRTKFLEQENGMLQDRISSLTRQRMALEKVVREYRMEKQKEDIYKSIGSGPSGLSLSASPGLGLGQASPGLGLVVPKTPFSSGLGNSITLAENDESINDQGRNISSLEYRTKFLEQENGMLQDRISSLTRQRMALEKVVREYRMEKQKEDIYKSIGSGPSGLSLSASPGLGLGQASPGLGLVVPKTPFSSGLGNSITNSLVSGTDAGRSVGGLLMKSNIGTPSSAKAHGYPNGLGMDSPRVADSDGMSADTEGR